MGIELLAGLVPGLGGAAADIYNSAKDREVSQQQFDINRWDKYAMYDDAKRYNTMMSNTAYQRQKADMEAAGINPMLAIMKGGGASSPTASPSPSQGYSPMPNRHSIAQAMQNAVGGAFQAAQAAQNIRESESRVALQAHQADTEKTKQELNTASAVSALKGSRLTAEKLEHLASERQAVKQEANLRQKRAFIDEELAVPDAIGSRAGSFVDRVLRFLRFPNSAKSVDPHPKSNRFPRR